MKEFLLTYIITNSNIIYSGKFIDGLCRLELLCIASYIGIVFYFECIKQLVLFLRDKRIKIHNPVIFFISVHILRFRPEYSYNKSEYWKINDIGYWDNRYPKDGSDGFFAGLWISMVVPFMIYMLYNELILTIFVIIVTSMLFLARFYFRKRYEYAKNKKYGWVDLGDEYKDMRPPENFIQDIKRWYKCKTQHKDKHEFSYFLKSWECKQCYRKWGD